MAAAVARLECPPGDAQLEARAAIDLGSCVRFSLSGGWARVDMTEDGVVVDVVPPGAGVPLGVSLSRPNASSRSSVARYVVQWGPPDPTCLCLVIRRAAEMVVVCL